MQRFFHRAVRILIHPVTVVILGNLIGCALYWWPKSVEIPGLPQMTQQGRAYYHGFYWAGPIGFGARYFRITVDCQLADVVSGLCRYNITYKQPGYNAFELRDSEERLLVSGTCLVEQSDSDEIPVPRIDRLESADFYKPDGSIGSQIREHQGTMTLWYSNGEKVAETEIDRQGTVQTRLWYANGKLASEAKRFDDDSARESYVLYYENGSTKINGQLLNGKRNGKWICYTLDGAVERIEYYDHDRLIRTENPAEEIAPSDRENVPAEENR